MIIAQVESRVGDFAYNFDKVKKSYSYALEQGKEIVIFPEMMICGYQAEDLVLNKKFQEEAKKTLNNIALLTKGKNLAIIIGGIDLVKDEVFNSAFFIQNGEIEYKHHKNYLPSHTVFDEKRVFAAGKQVKTFTFNNKNIAILICEDIWHEEIIQKVKDADVIIAINASPFEKNKFDNRFLAAKKFKKNFVYVNKVGAQDDLVFDGGSFVCDKYGKLAVQFPYFIESFSALSNSLQDLSVEAQIYEALKLALRSYVEKNGFPSVIIGMSGGVDSAITAAIAVDALGKEKVKLVMMPSEFTSDESLKDAQECADNLGVKLDNIAISNIFSEYKNSLLQLFSKIPEQRNDVSFENIQSRIRAVLLMAISNRSGGMVLSTGNKSEMAVGYATIYGDMCGGYNVLKDVYKTEVYKLCKYRNKINLVIPENIIKKAPTAELKENQKDVDSLPDYEVLDKILYQIIEEDLHVEEVSGFDKSLVEKVARLIKISEYKRKQSPPGPKISKKPFTRDRRYPITNLFS